MGFLDTPDEGDEATTASTLDADPRVRAEAHRIDLLFAGTVPSIGVSVAVGGTLAIVQWEHHSSVLIWSWVTALALVLLGRYLLLIAYRRAESFAREPGDWALRYCAGAWMAGAVWGAAGWFFLPVDYPFHQVFTLLALAGLSAGALTVLAVDIRGYTGFVALSLIPLVLHSIFRGADSQLGVGVLALAFSLFLLRAGRSISRSVMTSLYLQYENRALADRLGEEKARLGHRLARVFNDLSSEILVFDAATLLCQDANAGACRDLGYSNEVLRGMSLPQINPALSEDATRELAAPLLQGNADQVGIRGHHRRSNGSLYPVEIRLQYTDREDPPVFVITALDVTERASAETRAHERGALVRSMLRSAPIALWAVDESRAITRISGNLSLVRVSKPELRIGSSVDILESTYPQIVRDVDQALQGESAARDVLIGRRTLEVHHSPMKGEDGAITGAIGVAVDITERKMFETRLLRQANTDALTGLPNMAFARQNLQDALATADREGWQVAVFYLDLDNFKNVNDSLGHSTGDGLLVDTARRLESCVRDSDFIARLGGDEFLFLLEGMSDTSEAQAVAQKLNRVMNEPFRIGGQELFVTSSVGVSIYPQDGRTPEELLQHADSALYGAKKAGRNTYCFFTHQMRTAAEERMSIESNLRRALERNEFSLLYQPLVRCVDREIVGAEVLLRWQSPTLGAVPPSTFISVAEEAGLISAIGDWVLSRASEEAVTWQADAERPIRLSVNVSSRQFRDEDFLVRLQSTLKSTGLRPDLLELEITERLLVEDAPSTRSLLVTLAEMGIRLALDDFGTGYSSLSYLTRFPVHVIKVDRSFVRAIGAGGPPPEIVNAIIALAHSLKLDVVVEGVETAEQLAYARERGVEFAQGFYLHRPLPAETFRNLLRASVRPSVVPSAR